METYSPIFSRTENRIKAIIYGEPYTNGRYAEKGTNGFMIWRHPDKGECTAMVTVPSDDFQVKGALNMLEKNEWKLKSIRMHSCPLANSAKDFGETKKTHLILIPCAAHIQI
jgi:hypothetical protein